MKYKNADFYADSKFLELGSKMFRKKLFAKTWEKVQNLKNAKFAYFFLYRDLF
jgi:hypothetical protein